MRLVIDIPEEAKLAFDNAESNDLKCSYYDHGGVIGNAIKNGILYEERPKGRWIDMSSGYAFNDKCSKCGFIVHEQFINNYHFCPNCGCQMEGEQK